MQTPRVRHFVGRERAIERERDRATERERHRVHETCNFKWNFYQTPPFIIQGAPWKKSPKGHKSQAGYKTSKEHNPRE